MRKLPRQALHDLSKRLLHTNDTPERTAFAFALGTAIGFSPFIMCHWGLALILSIFFRLNKVALFAGTFVNNPYTYFPIMLGGTQFGAALLGRGWIVDQFPRPHDLMSATSALGYLQSLKPMALPFFLGNMTLSILSFLLAYALSLRFIRHRRNRSAQEAEVELAAALRTDGRHSGAGGPSHARGGGYEGIGAPSTVPVRPPA